MSALLIPLYVGFIAFFCQLFCLLLSAFFASEGCFLRPKLFFILRVHTDGYWTIIHQ
jgi:hypothetical protein